MAGHTRGPWRAQKPAHIRWDGPTGAFEIVAGETLICQRPWAEGSPAARVEYEANARLIAASPNLLTALIEARDALAKTMLAAVQAGADLPVEHNGIGVRLDQVIAQATGYESEALRMARRAASDG